MKKAVLMLANGEIFQGRALGYFGEATGEVVFNTSMTGYQEILTDPSYAGQMVTMTYTEIGNYGTNSEDVESDRVQAAGFIVREASSLASNHRSEKTLQAYLEENHITAIEGIDTRKLTRILRISGAQNGIISHTDFDPVSLRKKLDQVPSMAGLDLVEKVTIQEPKPWGSHIPGQPHVVAIHTGIKYNILRLIAERGVNITLVPARFSAEQILALRPQGVFLANGPGDPAAVKYTIRTIQALLGQVPLFGICLGHQLLAHALGGRTFKLKFGHRGGNQPVKNLLTGRVEITSQNHGFAVRDDSLPDTVEITHVNLNDGTVEGIRHKTLPAFSVQYHPEASPGPHDSLYLFDQFVSTLRS